MGNILDSQGNPDAPFSIFEGGIHTVLGEALRVGKMINITNYPLLLPVEHQQSSSLRAKPYIDGQPELRSVPGTPFQHVINSPATLFYDTSGSRYYLDGNGVWVTASTLDGPRTAAALRHRLRRHGH